VGGKEETEKGRKEERMEITRNSGHWLSMPQCTLAAAYTRRMSIHQDFLLHCSSGHSSGAGPLSGCCSKYLVSLPSVCLDTMTYEKRNV